MRVLVKMMRTLVHVFGTCLTLSLLGIGFPVAAVNQPFSLQLLNRSRLAQNDTQTLLQFETQNYIARVYQQQGLTFLNVYNKETGFTDQNGVLAYVAPPQNTDDTWRTYVNRNGDLQYMVRVSPLGMTELEIRLTGGGPAEPETGYNATYSFPHTYLGQDVDITLLELEELGWVVDSTQDGGIELTRDKLILDLKFDPDTRSIIYTQLIDTI